MNHDQRVTDAQQRAALQVAKEEHTFRLDEIRSRQIAVSLGPLAREVGKPKHELWALATSPEADDYVLARPAIDLGRRVPIVLLHKDDKPAFEIAEATPLSDWFAGLAAEVDRIIALSAVQRKSPDTEGFRRASDLCRAIEMDRCQKLAEQIDAGAAQRTPSVYAEELADALMTPETRETLTQAAAAGNLEMLGKYLVNISIAVGPDGKRVRVAEVAPWHHRDNPKLTSEESLARLGMGGRQMTARELYELVGTRERLRARFGAAAGEHPLATRTFLK